MNSFGHMVADLQRRAERDEADRLRGLRLAIAAMAARKPDEVTAARHQRTVDAAQRFLIGGRAEDALACGWSNADLLSPPRPGRPTGLLWIAGARFVTSINAREAVLSDGSRIPKPVRNA